MSYAFQSAWAFARNSVSRAFIVKSLVATAAAVAVGIASPAAHASVLDFVLANFTNQPIVSVWTASPNGQTWYAVQAAYVPQDGGYQKIEFPLGNLSANCEAHIKVRFAGGVERYWRNVNLCGIRAFGVSIERGEVKGYTY